MKTIYRCDYCYMDFFIKEECMDHELLCNENPSAKSCETCTYHGTAVADTGKVWFTCYKNMLPTDGKWINNFSKNCKGWESRKDGKI